MQQVPQCQLHHVHAWLLIYKSTGALTEGKAAAAALNGSERYGLLGLLHVIRMTDPNLTMLALGTDLTGLGELLAGNAPHLRI